MQRDLEASELFCKHDDAHYGSDALRREKNHGRTLQRKLARLEAENHMLKGANRRRQQACAQWRESYANVSVHVQSLVIVLLTQRWL